MVFIGVTTPYYAVVYVGKIDLRRHHVISQFSSAHGYKLFMSCAEENRLSPAT